MAATAFCCSRRNCLIWARLRAATDRPLVCPGRKAGACLVVGVFRVHVTEAHGMAGLAAIEAAAVVVPTTMTPSAPSKVRQKPLVPKHPDGFCLRTMMSCGTVCLAP
jgi:hypothetical protein